MDFSAALTYQFHDGHWPQRFLLAALISLIPVFGPVILLGWSLAVTRRMIDRQPDLVPELDLASDLWRGLKALGLNLIYSLPAIILSLPLAIGLGLIIAANDGHSATVWVLAGLCLIVLLIAYSLVLAMVMPAVYATFLAQNEQFIAGLRLPVVLGLIRRAPAAYLLVFLGAILCAFITFFGLVGCLIGVVATNAYTTTVMAHLYGQAYLEASPSRNSST